MANPYDNDPLPRDPALKAIFSHPRMIADTLRGYVVRPHGPLHPRTIQALDFDTLEKLPAEWITPDFRRRIGDQAWRVRFRWARDWSAPGGYLLILVEFQSQRRSDMAQRMASYALRLYDDLETTGVLRRSVPRPLIFPLVLYNGPGRWTPATTLGDLTAAPTPPAASAQPEDIADARLAARDLAAFQLRHAYFALAFARHRNDDPSADNAMSVMIGMENAATLEDLLPPLRALPELADESLTEWMLEWTLRRLRVDDETAEEIKRMASLDEFHSRLEERAQGWIDGWLAEGAERGRAEGVAAQRAMLRRQAVLRFGMSAKRLDPLLDGVDSVAELSKISEWLVVDTLDGLIAKIEAGAANHIH